MDCDCKNGSKQQGRSSSSGTITKKKCRFKFNPCEDGGAQQSSSSPSLQSGSGKRSSNDNGNGPRMCHCGTDIFGRVLGPTADEAILAGLKSILEACRMAEVCDDTVNNGEGEDEGCECDEEGGNKGEGSCGCRCTCKNSQKEDGSTNTYTESGTGPAPEAYGPEEPPAPPEIMICPGGCVDPEDIEDIQNNIQDYYDDPPQHMQCCPEEVSRSPAGSYNSYGSGACQQYHVMSERIQTSCRGTLDRAASCMSGHSQRTNKSNQCSVASARRQSGQSGASGRPGAGPALPCSAPRPRPQPCTFSERAKSCCPCQIEDDYCLCNRPTCPRRPPPISPSRALCCSCDPVSDYEEGDCLSDEDPCTCCTCNAYKQMECCTCNQDKPIKTRYAFARISEFSCFTTYEIMKTTASVPEGISDRIQGVFVIKKTKAKRKRNNCRF